MNMVSSYPTIHILLIIIPFFCDSSDISYTSQDGCSVTFNEISTSFNLCPLKKTDLTPGQILYYKVKDSRSIENENNTLLEYFFNIGAPLELIPPFCENYTDNNIYCSDANCTLKLPINGIAYAYQIASDPKTNIPFFCTPLSNNNGGPPIWSLIHEDDPTEGVQLTYINGGKCADSTKNRKLNLQFVCENDMRDISTDLPLYEYATCEYTLKIKSTYGCPIECKEFASNLCGNNGLCGYDFTNKQPRCFCYDKYNGDDCSQYDADQTIGYNATKKHPTPKSPFVHTFYETNVNVTYDLNAYAISGTSSAYIVYDKDKSRNFIYYVGIPQPLLPPSMGGFILPSFCENITAPCHNIDIINGKCLDYPIIGYTNYGFVFQVNYIKEECFVLGTNIRWELYDSKYDPARGVSMVFYDGSYCESSGKNRQFITNLICPKDQFKTYSSNSESEINEYEYVEEDDKYLCSYEFTQESAVACPFQCITNSTKTNGDIIFTVCNGKGICAADPNAKMVRCLCDNGWKGIDCNIKDTIMPTYNPSISPSRIPTISPIDEQAVVTQHRLTRLIIVVVVLVLLILILIVIGYFGWKYAKLKIQKAQQSGDFTRVDDDGLVSSDVVKHALKKDDHDKLEFATIDK
eukprot:3653_1